MTKCNCSKCKKDLIKDVITDEEFDNAQLELEKSRERRAKLETMCKDLDKSKTIEPIVEPQVVVVDEKNVCPSCPVYKFKDITKDIRSGCVDKDLIIARIQSLNLDLMDLKTKYILIGSHLIDLIPYCKDIWSWKKARYCKNIYELAEHCFNLPKTTTVNIIAITKKFGHMMSTLKTEYEEYSFTQLSEMVSLSDEQLKLVNPEMTVQEIRAMKKANKKTGPLTDQRENTQPVTSFLTFKNDTERRYFIDNYDAWGLWLEFPELNLKFYKAELNNGDFLVVTEYKHFLSKNDKNYQFLQNRPSYIINIIKRGTSPTNYGYFPMGDSLSNVLDYIRHSNTKVAIKYDCKTFEEYKLKVEAEKRRKGYEKKHRF